MIRDTYLRAFFIPLLGIIIPLISGIVTYTRYSIPALIAASLFFIVTSLLIWAGCNWIHGTIRRFYKAGANAFAKIFSLCMISALYGAAVAGFLGMIWFQFSKEVFSWHGLLKFIIACVLAVIVFTLVYEILFLSKERELDTKIVDQLDRERSQAELTALTSELDPHFMFNSLNTLSHLIINDPATAHLFNSRLARVYRYILINKERELISMHDEMEFIDNYFYLLQIRHDNKLKLETNLDGVEAGKIMVLPCALQILVENAIKHNEFSETNPLKISIGINTTCINVTNNVKPKPFLVNSTKIGLRNLRSRYKLVCNQDITIESTANEFTVKLPLIQ